MDLVSSFEAQRINFVSLADSLDPSTPAGRFFFHVMASLAEMEGELTVDRTRAGLESARLKGRVGKRKRLMTDAKVDAARRLLALGLPPREVASTLGASVATPYRRIPASESMQPGRGRHMIRPLLSAIFSVSLGRRLRQGPGRPAYSPVDTRTDGVRGTC